MTWKPEKPLQEYSVSELDLVRRRPELTPQDCDAVETAITALTVLLKRPCPWTNHTLTSFVELDGVDWSDYGRASRAAWLVKTPFTK